MGSCRPDLRELHLKTIALRAIETRRFSMIVSNLGVELGQLLVVGLALPIIVAAARRAPRRFERWGSQLGSGAAAAFGTVWLVARLIAL